VSRKGVDAVEILKFRPALHILFISVSPISNHKDVLDPASVLKVVTELLTQS
jgi:hypothetical protein